MPAAMSMAQAATAPEPHVSAELVRELANVLKEDQALENRFDTEVWLTDMNLRLASFINDRQQRLDLLKRIHLEATRADLNFQLVLSVIDIESRFASDAISHAGAQGLMQVMPFWKKEIGRESDNLFDPDTNLRYGCTILAWYLKVEKGDLTRALARYNGSLGRTTYPEQVMARWDTHWWVEG